MKTTRYSSLQLEALETRDALSARLLPVLMVIANQDYHHAPSMTSAAPTVQQDSFYGRGVYKATDAGQTWTLHEDVANQLTGAFRQSFKPNTPLVHVGGNETITIGVNHASNDYIQWRSRFGSGL